VPIQDGPVEIEVNFDFVMRDEASESAQEEIVLTLRHESNVSSCPYRVVYHYRLDVGCSASEL